MENSNIDTATLLRNAARENIKKYCDLNNESFDEGLKYVTEKAEQTSSLIPLEFYRQMYNISLELLNS